VWKVNVLYVSRCWYVLNVTSLLKDDADWFTSVPSSTLSATVVHRKHFNCYFTDATLLHISHSLFSFVKSVVRRFVFLFLILNFLTFWKTDLITLLVQCFS